MSFRPKKSHYDYHPLPREEGEPDGMDTIKLLPQVPREKLIKLFDDGTLRTGDLDHKSVMTLQQLSEPFQVKVIDYLQHERLFLFNSRSKAGFLVSACDRAKKGELDARGFGALDPWRSSLIAECTPRPVINLVPEAEWIAQQACHTMDLTVLQNDSESSIAVELTEQMASVKDRLHSQLARDEFSRSRLKLVHPVYGSLRDDRTVAFYNLSKSDSLIVKRKVRGGRKVNRHLY